GDKREVILGGLAGDDLVDGFDAARGADAAGRTLAAALDGAELEGKTGLLRHIGRIVEHRDATVPDEAVARREGLVVKGRIEKRAREVGTERTADLHGLDWTAAEGTAADIVDEIAERHAECRLKEAAV